MSAWMSGDVGRMTGIVLGHLVMEICLCPRATQRSKRVSGQLEKSLLYGGMTSVTLTCPLDHRHNSLREPQSLYTLMA